MRALNSFRISLSMVVIVGFLAFAFGYVVALRSRQAAIDEALLEDSLRYLSFLIDVAENAQNGQTNKALTMLERRVFIEAQTFALFVPLEKAKKSRDAVSAAKQYNDYIVKYGQFEKSPSFTNSILYISTCEYMEKLSQKELEK